MESNSPPEENHLQFNKMEMKEINHYLVVGYEDIDKHPTISAKKSAGSRESVDNDEVHLN